eukprot:3537366-Pleurochrysis_carterae.AAC.4
MLQQIIQAIGCDGSQQQGDAAGGARSGQTQAQSSMVVEGSRRGSISCRPRGRRHQSSRGQEPLCAQQRLGAHFAQNRAHHGVTHGSDSRKRLSCRVEMGEGGRNEAQARYACRLRCSVGRAPCVKGGGGTQLPHGNRQACLSECCMQLKGGRKGAVKVRSVEAVNSNIVLKS